jgi:hypothetical protein
MIREPRPRTSSGNLVSRNHNNELPRLAPTDPRGEAYLDDGAAAEWGSETRGEEAGAAGWRVVGRARQFRFAHARAAQLRCGFGRDQHGTTRPWMATAPGKGGAGSGLGSARGAKYQDGAHCVGHSFCDIIEQNARTGQAAPHTACCADIQ